MRSFVTWSVMFLATVGTANGETKAPPKELTVDLGSGVKMELVLIPAGEFMMGDDEDMKPIHKVKITKPFYLGTCEVTQQQWEAVNVTARSCRSANRRTNVPDLRADNIGLRVARVPSEK